MSTRNVTEHLADHLAIRSLLDRYTDALNRRDWVALEQVFADDAVWDAGGPSMGPMARRFEGAVACARGISEMVEQLSLCIQSNHAPAIHVHADRATASSTINEVVLAPGADTRTTIWGMYFDEIVRGSDGEWRFKLRKFRFAWIDTTGNAGQVITQPPSPAVTA
jgi:ketosteroid isomerase-like protein